MKHLEPKEAAEFLKKTPNAIFVDCRSEMEFFFVGHPPSAIHVAWNDGDGVPTFNTNRAETLASIDRFKKIAANLKATVILQHDTRHVSKLPAFPAAAK